MKMATRILFILAIVLASLTTYSQGNANVYKTCEDLKAKKALTVDKSMVVFTPEHVIVSIKGKGELKGLDIWGFSCEDKLYRRFQWKGRQLAEVMAVGEYVVYKSDLSYYTSQGTMHHLGLYISKDLCSPVYRFSSDRDIDALAEKDPAFKPLADSITSKKRDYEAYKVVLDYIMKSKHYKDIFTFFQ